MAKVGTVRFPKSGSADVLVSLESTFRRHQKPYLKHLMRLFTIFTQNHAPSQGVLSVQLAKLLGFQHWRNLVGPLANPLDLETQLWASPWNCKRLLLMRSNSWDNAVIITGPDNMGWSCLYGTNTYTLLEDGRSVSTLSLKWRFGYKKVELSGYHGWRC